MAAVKQSAGRARPRVGTPGHLSEMFCSIQGEGPFVGERQIFLRTSGCTATCSWCDTVYAKVRTPRFVIHDDATREKRAIENPVALERVVEVVRDFAARHHPVDTVSLTGGEPLEQAEFVHALSKRLHAAGLRIYLETNGLNAEALGAVLPYVDVVAMDIKLPSAVGVETWDDHRRFLSVLRGSPLLAGRDPRRGVFVKVVMDGRSHLDEVGVAVGIIAAVDPTIPLVLQPESETLMSRTPPHNSRRLLATMGGAQRLAMESLETVRVIPQLHKILQVR